MRIICPKCKTAYQIPNDKIPEKGASITCKVCKSKFSVSRSIEPGNDSIRTHRKSEESVSSKSLRQRYEVTKRRAILAFGLLLAIGLSFSAGWYVANIERRISVSYESSDDVKEDFDRSFGWGKAPDNIDVKAVDVIKGVYIDEYGDYEYPTPAVKLSIKNCGKNDLESFSLTCGFSDTDKKRHLGGYGTASGSIKAGWTSERELFKLGSQVYVDIVGNKPIDFRIRFVLGTETTKNRWITFYETEFSPDELNELPSLKH